MKVESDEEVTVKVEIEDEEPLQLPPSNPNPSRQSHRSNYCAVFECMNASDRMTLFTLPLDLGR